MHDEWGIAHTNFKELTSSKIPVLDGRAAENSRLVLKISALNGPLLKYDIHKHFGGIYSTVSRRVNDLRDRGYLREAGERSTERGRQSKERMYSLTWRGFVASLTIKEVRENVLQVLEKNPLLELPDKRFVLAILGEVFLPEDLEVISEAVLSGYLATEGPHIEQVDENVLPYLVLNSMKHVKNVPIKGSQMKDIFSLLDNPTILQYVKEKIERWRADLHDMYQLLTVFNKLGSFVLQLEATDTPSERLREFCENDLPTILSELEDESTRGDKQ